MSSVGNDNHTSKLPKSPDAHGQAAFLLVQSLIFALREKGVLTTDQAVEVAEVAAEVKEEVAAEWGDAPETLRRSLGLISNLASSLRADVINT